MTPTDAAKLLLAIMYDDELAIAERSASNLYDAPLVRCRHRRFGEPDDRLDDFPRNGFLSADGAPLSLGQVITTVLDWLVRYGDLEEGDDCDLDLSVVNLRLSVSSPGYAATVHFNTHEGFWDLSYQWKPPEQLAYEATNKGKMLVKRWDAIGGPYMSSSRSVGDDNLYPIADLLRGCEWNDDWEDFAPSYEDSPTLAGAAELA